MKPIIINIDDKYAQIIKENKVDISQVVNGFLESFFSKNKEIEISPLVKKLTGVIDSETKDEHLKEEYRNFLKMIYGINLKIPTNKEQITLTSSNNPRKDWEIAFKSMSNNKHDELIDGNLINETIWDREEWEWE
jgi:hypothetical protein